jgi:hypothetical protein
MVLWLVQSKQNGNDVERVTTSHRPASAPFPLIASTSPAIRSEHQKRPSCQRAGSPIARPAVNTVTSVMNP